MPFDWKYLGDQMTIEHMEDNFREFSEDGWDSYNIAATTPEVIAMLRKFFLVNGRPAWFVAYEDGASMSYHIGNHLYIEIDVDASGMPDGMCVEYHDQDHPENKWYRYIGERDCWERYGVENIPHEV